MQLNLSKSTIRSFLPADAPFIAKHLGSYDVVRNFLTPYPYTLKDAEDWIARCSEEPQKTRFAIVVDGETAGGVGVELLGGINPAILGHTAEIGYWLAERHWGKGIMSEVVAAISELALSEFGYFRIQASVFARNPASTRVLIKAGYEYEGRQRARYFRDGQYIDGLLYAKVRLPSVT